MIKTWQFLKYSIKSELNATLLYVVQSSGSSPGRKGFVMALNSNGEFNGTIGGGIMEVKLIELAKDMLNSGHQYAIIKSQHHDKDHARNRSGMICSGEQSVAIVPVNEKNLSLIESILNQRDEVYLNISESGLQLERNPTSEYIKITSEQEFSCVTSIIPPRRIHIFGGGHVGRALAKQMNLIGYRVIIYDDRTEVLSEQTSDPLIETKFVNYQNLSQTIEVRPTDVAAIVSFGYRSDKDIFKEINNLPFTYIGMMGSDQKIETLKAEFTKEGVSTIHAPHIFMPIGQPIYSQTVAEIAVSIAAQIILETNKHLPTGRNYRN